MVMQAPVKFTATHALQTRDMEYSQAVAVRFFINNLKVFLDQIGLSSVPENNVMVEAVNTPNGSKFTYSLSGRVVGKASFEMRETFAGFKIVAEFEQIL